MAGIVSLDINNQFSIASKYLTYFDQNTANLKFNVGDMVFDRRNNLWAISPDNTSYPFSVFTKDHTIHFSDRLPNNRIIDGSRSIVVDNYKNMNFTATKYNNISFRSPINDLITVNISGAVNYPGTYTLKSDSTLEDLYRLVGDFKKEAFFLFSQL